MTEPHRYPEKVSKFQHNLHSLQPVFKKSQLFLLTLSPSFANPHETCPGDEFSVLKYHSVPSQVVVLCRFGPVEEKTQFLGAHASVRMLLELVNLQPTKIFAFVHWEFLMVFVVDLVIVESYLDE